MVEEVIEDEDSWDDGEEVVVEDEVLRVLLLCPRVYLVQQKFVYDVTMLLCSSDPLLLMLLLMF